MIDMKLLRTEPEKVIAALARRKENIDIDELLALDREKREVLYEAEQKKAEQNAVSKKIPAMKKAGEDTAAIFAEMKQLSDDIKACDEKIRELDEKAKAQGISQRTMREARSRMKEELDYQMNEKQENTIRLKKQGRMGDGRILE